jgi:hypothetical protein
MTPVQHNLFLSRLGPVGSIVHFDFALSATIEEIRPAGVGPSDVKRAMALHWLRREQPPSWWGRVTWWWRMARLLWRRP